MAGSRLAELLAALEQEPTGEPYRSLCRAVRAVLDTDDVVVSVLTSRMPLVVCATSSRARAVDELQLVVGEGPVPEAMRTRRPVSAGTLRGQVERWPVLTATVDPAVAVTGVLSVPLALTGVKPFAVLSCYGLTRVRLSRDELPALAEAVAFLLLATVGSDLPAQGELSDPECDQVLSEDERAMNAASGLVAAQCGVTPAVAVLRLRAHAFASGATLRGVADDVVATRLQLQP